MDKTVIVFEDDSDQYIEIAIEDVLLSLREHPLVAEATYKNGEFFVTPKADLNEKTFSFKMSFGKEKDDA